MCIRQIWIIHIKYQAKLKSITDIRTRRSASYANYPFIVMSFVFFGNVCLSCFVLFHFSLKTMQIWPAIKKIKWNKNQKKEHKNRLQSSKLLCYQTIAVFFFRVPTRGSSFQLKVPLIFAQLLTTFRWNTV